MSKYCTRCLNQDPAWFGNDHGTLYCRRCISFGRLDLGDQDPVPSLKKIRWNGSPRLKFELTDFQKNISAQALNALRSGRNVFIFASAGAGKTEISLQSISWYLNQGLHVGFAISRRQVVIEIAERLQEYFPDLKVSAVCEGYPKNPADRYDSDLIVCTMHQLYRYPNCFDLLIMDEVDAFPYAGNEMLRAIADRACRGQKMLLSATPDDDVMEQIEQGKMELCELFVRPHKKPLCVPRVRKGNRLFQVLMILAECRTLIRQNKQILVFVPRRADGWWMKALLSLAGSCGLIHSEIGGKDAIMNRFRSRQTRILVSTTLLERGITVPSVQVLIYRADHPVFTCASLVQIFGRVGRTFDDPEGIGICYCERRSDAIKSCVSMIEKMNRTLYEILQAERMNHE